MLRSKSLTVVVTEAVLLPLAVGGSPPPLTLAVFTTCGTAVLSTFTTKVTVVDVAPARSAVERVHSTPVPPTTLFGALAAQVQPAPATGTEYSVRPVGSGSDSVYVAVPV